MSSSPLSLWRHTVRRLGHTGIAATVLLAAGVVLLAAVPHLQSRTLALQDAQAVQADDLARKNEAVSVREVPLGEQIDGFVAAFPLLPQHVDDMRAVFAAAQGQKLKLLRGEYQFRNDANAPLVTVTASFPVTADYGTIKAFTAEVLKNVPHASLDELRMTRDNAGSKTLESWIRFSFLYRKS